MNVKKWMAGLMVAFLAVLSLALPLPGTSTAPLLEAAASDTYPELSIEQKTLTVSEAAGQTVTLDVHLNSPSLTRFLLMLHYDESLQDVEIESVMEQLPGEYTAFSENHHGSDNYQTFLWKSTGERSFDEVILRMTFTLPEDVQPGDEFPVEYLPVSPLTGDVCEWNNTWSDMQYADSLLYLNGGIQIVEDQSASGTCGENLTWEFDNATGTLTISGTGEMDDYFYNSSSPWNGLEITSAVIEDGVTSIGYYAFYKCEFLTSVTIPESVTGIGDYAFKYCKALPSVTIPDSVTGIGDYAFEYCKALPLVTIPDSVTSIGDYAFCKCESLTSVTIPESVMIIGRRAFYGTPWLEEKFEENPLWIYKNSLIDVDINFEGECIIPEGVTSIGAGAFTSCASLTSVTIPDSVTSIGDAAFYGCESLTSVTIPDSVTSIKYGAFEYCSSLTSVTILDPDCEICDSASTICNDYDGDYFFTGTIYGYENSTAQAYAEKYGYAFTSIGAAPEPTTAPGDLDGDGCITIFDLGLMKNGVKNGFATASMMITADVDQNGIIEEEDVRLLQAFLLGRK